MYYVLCTILYIHYIYIYIYYIYICMYYYRAPALQKTGLGTRVAGAEQAGGGG